MKIIVVGGTGTIGKAIVTNLKAQHEVVVVGGRSGEVNVDITDPKSIAAMYEKIGAFDALVSATGEVKFLPLTEFTQENYEIGLKSKLMGQVSLVMQGLATIRDGGSFTLTSGILSQDPIMAGSSASMVNGAIDSYVKAAAIEMPRGIRINSVSPTLLTESADAYGDFFQGFDTVPANIVALAYRKSVLGAQTGQTYKVGY